MATKRTRKKISYIYQYLNGETAILEVGKDGVTKELLNFLKESDHEFELSSRYQTENESYEFQNFMKYFGNNPDGCIESPEAQIADPRAEIASILFPEDDSEDLPLEEVSRILQDLSENQQDLIWDAYGLLKGDTEIAKEQNVTREAIQNRRKRILKQVEKRLSGVNSQKS